MPTTAVEPTEEIDWTRVDRKIVSSFGRKSVKELSKETNIPQEVLLQRKQELVDSVDALTIQMQKHQLMGDLQEIADQAREKTQGIADEFLAGVLNSRIAAIKELMKQLTALEKVSNVEVESLNELRTKELLRLMDRVVASGIERVVTGFGLDRDEVTDIFLSQLAIEAEAMDNR